MNGRAFCLDRVYGWIGKGRRLVVFLVVAGVEAEGEVFVGFWFYFLFGEFVICWILLLIREKFGGLLSVGFFY